MINCGSSSIRADVIDPRDGSRGASGRAERLGTDTASVRIGERDEPMPGAGHAEALARMLPVLQAAGALTAVGHRVVHGGQQFSQPTRITAEVEAAIERLASLAPLHNPANLAGIRAARALLPALPHVAVFDTAFHATLPRRASTYALPADLCERHGLRRYGFHGTSHAYVSARAAEHLGSDIRDLRIITCHLGNGASVCAVEYGRSVETSMGMTPLEGLVMGTRGGDVDPGLLLELMRREELDVDALDKLLNQRSGLAGISGTGGDLRDIEAGAAGGDEGCRLAIHVLTHRLRKYIGAYAAVMGGADAIVFTGGIGENSALVRHRTAQRLEFLGARLDEDRNREAKVSPATPVVEVSEPGSRTRLLVVATDEERAIARETVRIAASADAVGEGRRIPIAISARHLHLTTAAVEQLFGAGRTLTPLSDLSQTGQYACVETVSVVGPRRTIEGVRVLGPVRPACQVEVSRTDEFFLGVDAPVRDSGDVRNSPGVTLVGPAGSLTLTEGLICARRHIHMAPADAAHFGVKDRDVVEVSVDTAGRDLTFGDVLVRVHPDFRLEMHVDTDEANAAELSRGAAGDLGDPLQATVGAARILRRKTGFDGG